MNKNEVLDNDLTLTKEGKIFSAVRWWERRRLLYNVLLVGVEVIVSLSHYESLVKYGIDTGVIQTIIVNIIANMFYCLGWGIEVLASYYLPRLKFTETSRRLLYAAGLLFSLIIAWLAYDSALNYYLI